MDGSFWKFVGKSGMAQATSDSILGVIRKKSRILEYFEIFITTALKGTYGNRHTGTAGKANMVTPLGE